VIYLAIAVGGAAGSLARYGVGRAIGFRGGSFPWATFTVNVTGCFLIGVATATLVERHHLPPWARVGLVVGVLGGYTTFSTFGQEGYSLFDSGDVAVALAYAAASVVVGILAVYLGVLAGRTV
jgi:fluoride exporter